MAQTLIQQIEDVLDRKLEQKLEEVFDRKLDEKLEPLLDRKLDEKLDEKLGVFMEHMDDKFDSLAEAVHLVTDLVSDRPTRQEFEDLKADVNTIKLAVRDTNREMHDL